jgi:hypothetical protein
MGTASQATGMKANASGQEERGGRAEGASCRTFSLHDQDWRGECRAVAKKSVAPALSLHP